MLQKCSEDFNFYFLASTNLEVWGTQFKSLSINCGNNKKLYNSLNPDLIQERIEINLS